MTGPAAARFATTGHRLGEIYAAAKTAAHASHVGRNSLHVYNSAADVDEVLDALERHHEHLVRRAA